VAKHCTPKQRRIRKAMLAGAATASVSGALVLGQAIDVGELLVNLTATDHVIGIGGKDDPTSANIPDKLNGLSGIGISPVFVTDPLDPRYVAIHYPANLDLGGSRDVGVLVLHPALQAAGPNTVVVGYSEGTLVAEQEKRNLQAAAPNQAPLATDPDFVQIASPFAGNGGIFGRFQEIPTFLIVDNMGPAEATRFDTTYEVNEYDPYGDFPAYFNPLSLANSALAIEYAHPDVYYNGIDPGTSEQLGQPYVVHNSAQGTDTYIIYYNDELPLLAPIRQAAAAAGITPYVEPELDLIEPTLRVLIDMGYTDRENLDPTTPTRFSLITPPEKIIGAVAQLPGAIQEGIGNFVGDVTGVAPQSTLNRSAAPGISGSGTPPVTVPKVELPKVELPKVELPQLPTPPKPNPPKPGTPAIDALKLDPPKLPKLPITSRQSTSPNLGLLVKGNLNKPNVVAGDGPTKPPSFGGGRPAGVLSGALKNIGLTGKPTGDKPAPAPPS
jgi:diacyltrehalose acyltransferase